MDDKYVEKDTDSEVSLNEVEGGSPKPTAREGPKLFLDTGNERMRYRKNWWQLW